jgi:nitroreductase
MGPKRQACIGRECCSNPYVVAWYDGWTVALKSVQSLKVLRCTWPIAEALLSSDGDEAVLRDELRDRGAADPDAQLERAREAGILISEQQLREWEEFFDSWPWGPVAAVFMFGYHTDSFVDPADELRTLSERETAPPSLLPDEDRALIELPSALEGGLVGVVARRRSRRAFDDRPIGVAPIAGCLRAAFGVTGGRMLEDGRIAPLTGAPSPGGLNTYDAFLLSRRVVGVEEGTYRYVPQRHALAREEGSPVPFDRLFGGQAWCAGASCAIVLVANLERQASRYAYPTTLSAVLMEAGARVELLLLQAEEASLSAVVVGLTAVGAFDRQLASAAGLPSATSMTIPICAVVIGTRPVCETTGS